MKVRMVVWLARVKEKYTIFFAVTVEHQTSIIYCGVAHEDRWFIGPFMKRYVLIIHHQFAIHTVYSNRSQFSLFKPIFNDSHTENRPTTWNETDYDYWWSDRLINAFD